MTEQTKKKWFNYLGEGINQSVDEALLKEGESPFLSNVVLDELGNWKSRPGTDKKGDTVAGSTGVYGCFTWYKTDDTKKLYMVAERDLFEFTESTGAWTDKTAADVFPASTKVNAVNFLERLYIGSADGATALRYWNGTSLVSPVAVMVGGAFLAVNKQILAVGGNAIKKNVIFYSDPFTHRFHSATGTCAANADVGGANTVTTTTSIFEPDMKLGGYIYNTTEGVMAYITDWTDGDTITTDTDTSTWDDDTVYVLQNYFICDRNVRGIVSYQENFVAFDEDTMYVFDPTNPDWGSQYPGFGCVEDRTIQVVDGNLMWLSKDAINLWNGSGRPVDVSKKIKNNSNGYGLFDLIDWTNDFSAGVLRDKYFLTVGTLQTRAGAPASGASNATLVFDTKDGSWTLENYNATVWTGFIDSTGEKELIFGESGANALYSIRTWGQTVDDNSGGTTTDITITAHTPFYVLGGPIYTTRLNRVYVKYESSSTVTVSIAKDGGSYSSLVTLPAASSVSLVEIIVSKDLDGVKHSLKFETTGSLTIEGYGFDYTQRANLNIKKI